MAKLKIQLPVEPTPPASEQPATPAAVASTATDYQKRFAEARKARRLTLEELGAALELSKQAISQFENGKSSISLVNFLNGCTLLGVRTEWVLHGLGKMWKGPADSTGAVQPTRKRLAARKPAPEAPQ